MTEMQGNKGNTPNIFFKDKKIEPNTITQFSRYVIQTTWYNIN